MTIRDRDAQRIPTQAALSVPVPTVMAAPLSTPATPMASKAATEPAKLKAASQAAQEPWRMIGGLTLRQNIERMAAASGFEVLWVDPSLDYAEVSRPLAALPGTSFDDPAGPIWALSVDYGPATAAGAEAVDIP